MSIKILNKYPLTKRFIQVINDIIKKININYKLNERKFQIKKKIFILYL